MFHQRQGRGSMILPQETSLWVENQDISGRDLVDSPPKKGRRAVLRNWVLINVYSVTHDHARRCSSLDASLSFYSHRIEKLHGQLGLFKFSRVLRDI